jgi:hypothetical protein
MKHIYFMFLNLIIANLALSDEPTIRAGEVPKNGFVPTAEVAAEIAKAVSGALYGKDEISKQEPFKCVLKGDVWHIEGTAPANTPKGTVMVELRKDNGTIIKVTHTQ